MQQVVTKVKGSNTVAIFSSASSICGILGEQQSLLNTRPSVRRIQPCTFQAFEKAQSVLSYVLHHSQAENRVKDKGAPQPLVLNSGLIMEVVLWSHPHTRGLNAALL